MVFQRGTDNHVFMILLVMLEQQKNNNWLRSLPMSDYSLVLNMQRIGVNCLHCNYFNYQVLCDKQICEKYAFLTLVCTTLLAEAGKYSVVYQ